MWDLRGNGWVWAKRAPGAAGLRGRGAKVTGEVVSGTIFAHGHATGGACPAVSPYRVVIALADVRVPGQSGPTTGTFRGTLTHYSTNRSGTCQPYAASLKGELSISA